MTAPDPPDDLDAALDAMVVALTGLAEPPETDAILTADAGRRLVEADQAADAEQQPRPAPAPSPWPRTALTTLRAYVDQAARCAPPGRALAALDELEAATDRLLTLAVVADQLGLSVDTVRRLIDAGDLYAVRLGLRSVRVPAGSLARYRSRLRAA